MNPTTKPWYASAGVWGAKLTFALVLAACAGCAVLTTPAGPYVAADRATYDAVAPEYRAYVSNDPALDPEQRARRERTVEMWRLRLDDAERRANGSQASRLNDDPNSNP